MSVQITSAELNAAVTLFRSASFGAAIGAIEAAFGARLADPGADAIAVEDLLAVVSDVPGLEDAAYAEAAIKLLTILFAAAIAPPNGGVAGAFADSLAGVRRQVANPSGALG